MKIKNVYLIALLFGAMIPISNSSVVDNSLVTGVYEGSCIDYYDLKATLKGANGERVTGTIEFYPKPDNQVGSCGAFTVDGTLSFRLFEDNFLILHSDTWLYFSGTNSIKKGTSAEGYFKFDGPFRPESKGYDGFIYGSSRAMEFVSPNPAAGIIGCPIFLLKRISNKYPETLTLQNKEKCENGMIDASVSRLEATSVYNILGLKLYMTPAEAEPMLEKMRGKDFTLYKKMSNTFYLRPQQSYIERISATKKGEDTINITFFKPPHDNTISSIVRIREYENDLKKAPYAEEVINFMINKYGTPKKQVNYPLTNSDLGPTILWTNYKCLRNKPQTPGPRTFSINPRHMAMKCGTYFGFSYDEEYVTYSEYKGKIRSYILSLYDDTGIKNNEEKIKEVRKLYKEEKERLRLEEKNRRVKGSKFSDDI